LSNIVCVKYWEIIANNLSKLVGVGAVSPAVDSGGRTIFVADAHRSDGKRFVVHTDEELTAFVELESAIWAASWLDEPWPLMAGSVARPWLQIKALVGLKKELDGVKTTQAVGG
jgi:hypothetical protein